MSIADTTNLDTTTTTALDSDTAVPAGGFITVHKGLIDDVNLYVEDTGGTGRPVILIHGWPLSSAAWENQIGAFSDAGYRVLAYDRRGFGRSDKPGSGYDYDTLAEDLQALIEAYDLRDVTLVGFSMGGGEVARYIGKYGQDRIRSIVLASAVTPYMAKTDDNPDGPLDKAQADDMEDSLKEDRDSFFPDFVNNFYTADGELKVSDTDVDKAIALCQQADQKAALKAMEAFGTTDFRDDLAKVTVPTLVIHGAGDEVVPYEGSGKRTAAAIEGSELVVIDGAPHGANVSNTDEWNSAVLSFLKK